MGFIQDLWDASSFIDYVLPWFIYSMVRKHIDLVITPFQNIAIMTNNDRYYLNDLLSLVGITDKLVKSKINVGIACWGMVCGFACALTAARFKRRKVYLTCVCCLLSIYVGWTVSMERYLTTKAQAAAVMTIVFIFVYSPAYSLGYNALTYSKLNPPISHVP